MNTTLSNETTFSMMELLQLLRKRDFIMDKSTFGYIRCYKLSGNLLVAVSDSDNVFYFRMSKFAQNIGEIRLPREQFDMEQILKVIDFYDKLDFIPLQEELVLQPRQDRFFYKILKK